MHTVEVPVAAPKVICPLPEWLPLPELTWEAKGTDVTLPWERGRDLGLWIGEAIRWHDTAESCLAATPKTAPLPAKYTEAPVESPSITTTYDLSMAKIFVWLSQANEVLSFMEMPGVTVNVHWMACSEPLADAYEPLMHELRLCYETMELGFGVMQHVAAHEMAHAIINQLDIPYTGSQEEAADELATVVLIAAGRVDSVYETVYMWRNRAVPESPFNDHHGDLRRASELWKLAVGSQGHENYVSYWEHARNAWVTLLQNAEAKQ